MVSSGGVDVGVGTVGAATSVTVNPPVVVSKYRDPLVSAAISLKPMLSTMTGDEILEIVGHRNVLALGSTQEVLHDGVCIVAEGDLDRPIEAMSVPVLRGTLVRLVLLHQGDQFLRGPAKCAVSLIQSETTNSTHPLAWKSS